MATACGGFAGCSTCSWGGRGCAAAAVTLTRSSPATRWTSGEWRKSIPGRAWLQFEVTPERGGSTIRQTALFDPVGLAGLFYWYALWGIHQLVFAGMLRNIARAAEAG